MFEKEKLKRKNLQFLNRLKESGQEVIISKSFEGRLELDFVNCY